MEHIARNNEGATEGTLTEKQFKEALLRVATLGQWKLQGLKEPRKLKSQKSPDPAKKLSNGTASPVKLARQITESPSKSSPRQMVALQECKVLWQRQRSEISKLILKFLFSRNWNFWIIKVFFKILNRLQKSCFNFTEYKFFQFK